jgi:hypothetical protein
MAIVNICRECINGNCNVCLAPGICGCKHETWLRLKAKRDKHFGGLSQYQ